MWVVIVIWESEREEKMNKLIDEYLRIGKRDEYERKPSKMGMIWFKEKQNWNFPQNIQFAIE